MKRIYLLLTGILLVTVAYTQKKQIDQAACENWPLTAVDPHISDDGKYIFYEAGAPGNGFHLEVKAVNTDWSLKLNNVAEPSLTPDSRYLVFRKPKDTLGILELGTDRLKYIAGITSFQVPKSGDGKWLAYQHTGDNGEVELYNPREGTSSAYPAVKNYSFSDNGKVLVMLKTKDSASYQLDWTDLATGRESVIWKGGYAASSYNFDQPAGQMVFETKKENSAKVTRTIWYYRAGNDKAERLVEDGLPGKDPELAITGLPPKFNLAGNRIFFTYEKKSPDDPEKPNHNAAGLDIWSYKDNSLQSQQLAVAGEPVMTKAVINLPDQSIIKLTTEGDAGIVGNTEQQQGDQLLVRGAENTYEAYYRLAARPSFYLVSVKDGSRRTVKEHLYTDRIMMSPQGKYVIFYDKDKKNYFSYETRSGILINVSRNIRTELGDDGDNNFGSPLSFGLAGWMAGDAGVLLYDRYDIWLVDPSGKNQPVNITGGYGARNKTVLRIYNPSSAMPVFSPDKTILAMGFNRVTKDNGFFHISLEGKSKPEKLSMGPYLYYLPPIFYHTTTPSDYKHPPIKAKNAEVYLITRMSAATAPNLWSTTDFIHFKPLTAFAAEKDYNWMTASLIHWKTPDGKTSDGILYKPENFDPAKKYPVIFYLYEQLSDGLNEYLLPALSSGAIDIPRFVSNGYLVCLPDIHYKLGSAGQSVVQAVVSAANYLAKQPWVNKSKLGIQGHSFGGYEVNYLVTQTHLFAAAASASGPTDLVSSYGSMANSTFGFSGQYLAEASQNRIGATLWQKRDAYIRNSPVFYADGVITPLLMVQNQADGSVPFQQGFAFFTALRRLDKKTWMLQYDGEHHQVVTPENQKDLTTRLSQFFDHYLKDAPPPKWMTGTIPAKLKGIEYGLDLDYSGKQP